MSRGKGKRDGRRDVCVKCTEWEISILCAYSGGLGVFGGSCFSDI